MIKDIMIESIATFLSEDKLEKLFELIENNANIRYIIIEFPNKQFSLVENTIAKKIMTNLGGKIGKRLLDLHIEYVPEFNQICDFINIYESEQIARSRAMKCRDRQIIVLKDNQPVGVIKEHIRSAVFGGIPPTLYGERYDIFEKGTVKPKYQLACPECNLNFDFYEPKIKEGRILYCCPYCKGVIEE